MRVCDWIANFLYERNIKNVHGLMGGGAMGLNDGFIKHEKINYICYHHEQGAGHAAIGESKFTGLPAVVNPTTGCGGTNCATSVLNAWQDGVPVIFISGNVRLDTCSGWINQTKKIKIRKYGVQEHHIVDTFKDITKASYFVTYASDIPFIMQQAWWMATSGRPGPVWIDIPANVQTAPMPEEYEEFVPHIDPFTSNLRMPIVKIKIAQSNRPLVLAGYGIRQSNTQEQFVSFIEKYNLPCVSTYGARDYFPFNHHLNIGAVGIKGSRAGNFAMQNCDFLLVLGSSLNSSVIGYDPKQFSIGSFKIVVDVDENELNKDIVKIDLKIISELKDFFKELI